LTHHDDSAGPPGSAGFAELLPLVGEPIVGGTCNLVLETATIVPKTALPLSRWTEEHANANVHITSM
jgi:hypothetical protein